MAIEKDVIFVPTPSYDFQIKTKGEEAGYPPWAVAKLKEAWETMIKNFSRVHRAGVTIVEATDFVCSPLSKMGMNAREPELLAKCCASMPVETSVVAMACGIEEENGLNGSTNVADIIIVDRDLLKDVSTLLLNGHTPF